MDILSPKTLWIATGVAAILLVKSFIWLPNFPLENILMMILLSGFFVFFERWIGTEGRKVFRYISLRNGAICAILLANEAIFIMYGKKVAFYERGQLLQMAVFFAILGNDILKTRGVQHKWLKIGGCVFVPLAFIIQRHLKGDFGETIAWVGALYTPIEYLGVAVSTISLLIGLVPLSLIIFHTKLQ